MQQGICNPEFYGDLLYKFKKIIGNPNFSDLFKRIENRFKRAGYILDVMRQITCPSCLLLFTCNYVVSVGEVFSSSGYFGWATLFYCGTPQAFHIIILKDKSTRTILPLN